ncbi:MAG: Obg family GTPase CgtA, partial [Micromonosporaceae bacterium]|nr:Obg family GTPase CgtA [Micromonosporaceae bacterium]
PEARDLAELVRPDLESRGVQVFSLSAVTREGLRAFTYAVAEEVRRHRAAQPRPEATRVVLRPVAVDDSGFTVEPGAEGSYRVRGAKPERWVRQTDFSNPEAVGYLADRLARIGVEDELVKRGAEPGCVVRIGEIEFEWQPTLYAGEEFVPGSRGEDHRLETTSRTRAAERLAARKARRRLPGQAGDGPETAVDETRPGSGEARAEAGDLPDQDESGDTDRDQT